MGDATKQKFVLVKDNKLILLMTVDEVGIVIEGARKLVLLKRRQELHNLCQIRAKEEDFYRGSVDDQIPMSSEGRGIPAEQQEP